MAAMWARLEADVNVNIRRGAWYRVLRLSAREAVLDVNRVPTSIERSLLQLAHQPPQVWTVVPSPQHSHRFPISWGEVYGVCPNCRERAPLLEGHPTGQRCQRCNGYFKIDWDGAYLPSA